MSMQTVNLDTYSLSLLTAKEDILNTRSSTNWALFTYAGASNKVKLADSGVGGVAELAGKFHVSQAQYGLCRVGSAETGGHRIVMISWVGQNVDKYRRTECASHIPAIKNFFKEAHAFISAETVEDVTEEKIRAELSKTQAQAPAQWVRRSSRSVDKEDIVGTNYRKTNAAMEMRLINRDSFWARAEREEEQRKEEERRRAAEERRRLERERVLKDRKDAEERDRKMNEKLQMIEEQRRKQAEQEEALRRKEKLRWEQQQMEHEEDMRARLRRSESIEKAAEAAVLVSQRSMNPREFFRQLSSTSQSPTSPGSSRTGKPFRRYQRSLTDTAFIFSKAEESTASSPRSSPLVSPFSRAPPSPLYRATSPPASLDFRPVTSPQRPRAPMTPPTSPLRPAPPVSALPVVPPPKHQVQPADEPKAPSPTEPSAPPASPSLLASLSHSLEKNIPSQSHSETFPPLPPNTPTEPEPSTFCFEPVLAPQAPTAPLPERPQPNTELHTATQMHTELVSDTGYKVQAVLIEEEEEEDEVEENEEDKAGTQPQPCAFTTEPVQREAEEQEQVEEKCEQVQESYEQVEEKYEQVEEKYEQVEEKYEQVEEKYEQVKETYEQQEEEKDEQQEEEKDEQQEEEKDEQREEKDEQQEEEKDEQQQEEEEEEKEEEGLKQEAEPPSLEEPVELLQEEEEEAKDDREHNNQSEDRKTEEDRSQAPAEPAELLEKEEEPAVTDAEPICQEIKHETVVLSSNGITNGDDTQEQNGIERSLSPSDTELSSPELGVCYDLRGTAEEDDINEDKEQEISENGQEVLAERQMCVRALYDYQAEDESEISFEPGDIIRDVETVDKAWWRGWSKDGRQGLFPANYVETI
ncbi:drebrin-like protein A [Thunnus maccoyii]|uniref:drebrin-like protein A n=1 Tax=Thunnus maccoyii TaxID=8240 RepID=UPI001C4A93C2|nr:drebrin-like protein A [Thunnus maccoyii]